MVESLSQVEVDTCPACGHTHQWQMWVLVNLQDRPDLLVQLQDGSIRQTSCSHCGHDLWSNTALFVFNPRGFPRAVIMTTLDTRPFFENLSQAFMQFIDDEWRPDDFMVWLPQPILPWVFKRDVRSDLMAFYGQEIPRGADLYLDFLDDIRQAQRAV